ncbi:MAG TPA: Asp23/Gls24 family envelope stress response protein [Candidatus Avimonoglobus intestinipullorum]|uniref:Asp23/Gls24 family envelope stress response protein n=1 Tax=Candidatus Avimonoglobus intestinipullorum TaxID=2840699 RepID=A0A9D1LV88_9FIRM|nr:Asp23/Gls24 family envelope stress response protein [Candidatus Avimonoglobus intestinipullorum]
MAIMINSEFGDVTIENGVIASIAGAVVNKCYGVVGMAARSTKDGIVSLLKGDKIARGIKIEVEDNGIVIGMHIAVEYGVNIHAICDSIIHNVRYKIEEKTGLKVHKVNVQVESVRVQE